MTPEEGKVAVRSRPGVGPGRSVTEQSGEQGEPEEMEAWLLSKVHVWRGG